MVEKTEEILRNILHVWSLTKIKRTYWKDIIQNSSIIGKLVQQPPFNLR